MILPAFAIRLGVWTWAIVVGSAPPIDPESAAAPTSTDEDITWLMSAPWGKAAIILIAALGVLFVGNTLMTRKKKAAGGRMAKLDFDVKVARLEDSPSTNIRETTTGPAHLVGRILSSTGTLGSRDGHDRIWHNRAGSGRSTAVGADLAIIGDETGQVGIENLEHARVIAPREATKPHDTVSLYVGDLVQVLGYYTAEAHGEDEDPSKNVYGMMGSESQVQLRVLERYDAAESEPDSKTP